MKTRDQILKELKNEILGSIDQNTSIEEIFQNLTIRPILKIQNDLLISVFIDYSIKQKNVFFDLTINKKLEYIENNIQRDIKFRELLLGLTIGLFTLEEFNTYKTLKSNLNKRIINMIIERLKSQLQLLNL